MAAPLQMASAIFLLATKVMCAPSAIKAEQNTSSTKHNIPELESENIRESTLDFTAHFCEINPDILYLCRRGMPGLKKGVFLLFPLCSERVDKKTLNLRFFAKKQVNF